MKLTSRQAYLILSISIVILSLAGSIIRFCDLNPIAITFYRLTFAFIIILPFSIKIIVRELREKSYRDLAVIFIMGLFFALHFFTWIYSVQNTTIANATICLSLIPVFVGIGEYVFFNVKVGASLIVAIIFGIVGSLIVGIYDFEFSSNHYIGDISAIISSLFFAIYFLVGKKVRKSSRYLFSMPLIYLFSAIISLVLLFSFKIEFIPNTQTFIALIILAIFPTVLGHGSLVFLCRYITPTIISMFSLLDPLFSSMFAYMIFLERIGTHSLVGYLVIVIGLLQFFYFKNKERGKQ